MTNTINIKRPDRLILRQDMDFLNELIGSEGFARDEKLRFQRIEEFLKTIYDAAYPVK